ncbi:MAG: hypothetical protein R3E12_13420 [Candidatus Eisenbacteria bacterium]
MNLKRTAYRLLLLVLGAVAAISAFQMGSPFFARQLPREAPKFYDFRLWHGSLVRYEKLQTLYTTNQKGYFLAGSRVGYKYPPTYASLIRPFMGKPIPVIERYFLIANLIAILAAGAGLMVALGLRGDRLLLAIPVFVLLWRPTWKLFFDLQMEVPDPPLPGDR